MSRNAECEGCGITAADMPYEEVGLDLDEASDLLFERVGSALLCRACAMHGHGVSA